MEEAARPLPLSRQAVTVGEQVVSEGLADAFARQLYGDELGYTRIGVPHLHDLSLEVPRSA